MLAYPYSSSSVDILVHLVGIASIGVCVSVCMCVSVYAEGKSCRLHSKMN